MIVDVSKGKIVDESISSAFGEITLDFKKFLTPFGFAGGLYDRDTGLVHFGAREYDPQVGRWISKDPIGFAGGDANLFGYVLNDPVNFIDPGGLTGLGSSIGRGVVSGVAVGAAVGIAFGNPAAGLACGIVVGAGVAASNYFGSGSPIDDAIRILNGGVGPQYYTPVGE